MMTISGYTILSQMYESTDSLVYRAIREQDNTSVIMKVLKDDYPAQRHISKYTHEYHTIRSLNIGGVVTAYDLQKYKNGLALILEDVGGELLQRSMRGHTLTPDEFLRLAIRMAEIVGEIHAANVVHKNINPSSFIWNRATGRLTLTDFSLATTLSQEQPQLEHPQALEGEPAYISPEQTGRMNRPLDYRISHGLLLAGHCLL